MICNGRGDRGDHCCYIDGEVCEFLTVASGTPRCAIWGNWDGRWHNTPIGRWFAANYPGYNCGDWPQNIPDVRGGLCCWEEVLNA